MSISKPFRILSVYIHFRALQQPFFRCQIFHGKEFQPLFESGTVVFAARCYLPQKDCAIRQVI